VSRRIHRRNRKVEGLSQASVFDQEHYQAMDIARERVLRQLVSDLRPLFGTGKSTAVDVACGLGHHSKVLSDLGFDVLGVDARSANVEESRRRFPHLKFEIADAEDPALCKLGSFDLVLCLGLLYHLENPFRVIRSLSVMASKLVIVESMCYPSTEPVLVLMDENESPDQGVNYVAYYPSEAALVKMMLRAGLSHFYLPVEMPDHPAYRQDDMGFRKRTFLVAAKLPIDSMRLRPWPDTGPVTHPWDDMPPLCPIRGKTGLVYTYLERILHGKLRKREPNHVPKT
jgi:SAM-dependent methyltransferase